MWAALAGFFVGRGLRNAGLPEGVKQERYDSRREARLERRGSLARAPGAPIIGVAAGRLIWALVAVTALALAVLFIAHG